MQQQYHACNSSITHATAISRMQQQYHACDDSITYATAVSRMQQQHHACYGNIMHATAISRMQQVLANLRTGLDLRTNTSTHLTWSSPRFIPVVLISGLIFAETRSPSLALKRFLSHASDAWDTTCIYQQFNTQQFPIPLIISL